MVSVGCSSDFDPDVVPGLTAQETKKADVAEHPRAFHHVGSSQRAPRQRRVALYSSSSDKISWFTPSPRPGPRSTWCVLIITPTEPNASRRSRLRRTAPRVESASGVEISRPTGAPRNCHGTTRCSRSARNCAVRCTATAPSGSSRSASARAVNSTLLWLRTRPDTPHRTSRSVDRSGESAGANRDISLDWVKTRKAAQGLPFLLN